MGNRIKNKAPIGKYPLIGGTPIGMIGIVLGVSVICFFLLLGTHSIWAILPIVIVSILVRILNNRYEKNSFYVPKRKEYNYIRTDKFVRNLQYLQSNERGK